MVFDRQTERPAPREVWGERFESSLQPRTIGRADASTWPLWRAVLVDRGSIQIHDHDGVSSHRGACLSWIPWTPQTRLRIMAGTVGSYILIGSGGLNSAIGYKAESADLRSVADRKYVMPLAENAPGASAIVNCFDGILRELGGMSVSANTVIEALIRIVLIEIWRSQGAPGSYDSTANPSQRMMSRFDALIESRFRERWTVSAHARHIGISTDRLTDICRRFRGISPKRLIDARVETEARLLLENSTHSVEQIAGILGFPSAAQFNRFFKNQCGVPPGNYRRAMRSRQRDAARTSLHEWP